MNTLSRLSLAAALAVLIVTPSFANGWDGMHINGISLNGISPNGMSRNGIAKNRIRVDGAANDGTAAAALRVIGIELPAASAAH